jgi:hypothetical protein
VEAGGKLRMQFFLLYAPACPFNNLHAVQLSEATLAIPKLQSPKINGTRQSETFFTAKRFASTRFAQNISRLFLNNRATITPFVVCYKTQHWRSIQPEEGRS